MDKINIIATDDDSDWLLYRLGLLSMPSVSPAFVASLEEAFRGAAEHESDHESGEHFALSRVH